MFKFGLSHSDVFTQAGKKRFVPKWNMTVGEILQKEGTEATKAFWGADFWVRRWEMTLAALINAGVQDVVVTDCRFDEEAKAVAALGGKVIEIVRPDAPALQGRDPNHASERGINASYVWALVINDGSIKALKKRMLTLVNGWKENG
jgi:hypothetical protein